MARKKKKVEPETGMDRLRQMSLGMWGVIVVVCGLLSNVLVAQWATPGDSAAARGQQLGRGIATLLFVIVGLVMIVKHLIGSRKPTSKKKPLK